MPERDARRGKNTSTVPPNTNTFYYMSPDILHSKLDNQLQVRDIGAITAVTQQISSGNDLITSAGHMQDQLQSTTNTNSCLHDRTA